MLDSSQRRDRFFLALIGAGVLLHYLVPQQPYLPDLLFFLGTVLHCSIIWGASRGLIYVATAMVLGYSAEFIGINTGWVFGAYHYNATNPGLIFGVPYFIPIEYADLLYAVNMLGIALCEKLVLRKNAWMLAILTGTILTLKDLSTDPVKSTVEQIWIWNVGGPYSGEPIHNFVGWFFVFVVLTIAATGLAWHRGNMSQTVKFDRRDFTFPLLLVLAVVIFSVSLCLSVPPHFKDICNVSLFVLFIGTVPYLLLGWFSMRNRPEPQVAPSPLADDRPVAPVHVGRPVEPLRTT